jgi:hypothetical protein
MGVVVIACYRPREGKDEELLSLVREHVLSLREVGLVTDRASIAMRASDGTVLEVFEWASAGAIDRAHTDPAVQDLWRRFEEVCDFVPLAEVPGASAPFPGFEPIQ